MPRLVIDGKTVVARKGHSFYRRPGRLESISRPCVSIQRLNLMVVAGCA